MKNDVSLKDFEKMLYSEEGNKEVNRLINKYNLNDIYDTSKSLVDLSDDKKDNNWYKFIDKFPIRK